MKKLILTWTLTWTMSLCYSQCFEADIVLLIDWSGSEDGNEKILADAARTFADRLPLEKEKVRLALYTFNTWSFRWSNLTSDREKLHKSIGQMATHSCNGATYIKESLVWANWEFENQKKQIQRILILISDGEIHDLYEGGEMLRRMENEFPLIVYCIQVGGDNFGYMNLINLAMDINKVGVSSYKALAQDLKNLDLCP